MNPEEDLLSYLRELFFNQQPIRVAGQRAVVVGFETGIDADALLTITIRVRPTKIQ